MGENNIGLRYGVSTYDDVLPAMNRAAKNITLTGVPNVADPIVWSKKIYGQTGWFELQFQHEDVTYRPLSIAGFLPMNAGKLVNQ